MGEIIFKEFDLNLDSEKELLSALEDISLIHSINSGMVFSSPFFRYLSEQQPYDVKKISLYAKSKKEIDCQGLKDIIKNNLCPAVLIYRNSKTGDFLQTYFLPEAVENNPFKRKLIFETNLNKTLKGLMNPIFYKG